jgi:phenylalanyl-tRNA synthetase alpha chain
MSFFIFKGGKYMSIFDEIKALKEQALEEGLEIKSLKDLQDFRVKYLGKKGPIQALMKNMKNLTNEERPKFGAEVNKVKQELSTKIEELQVKLEELALQHKYEKEKIDISLPATQFEVGVAHPLTQIIDEIEELFISMGYDVVEGPEVEVDHYNFEMLNLPKGHPARDMQDTFYITEELLMRTHTSPVQARTMEANIDKGPIRMICPGKVYRRDDDDATHSHQFTQIEGLVVDEGISMADLKGTLETLAKRMFGEDREIRLRPSFFPFTEPSVEVDVTCAKCNGKGCNICKGTGWIEILGAGMVHPNVLEMAGYDSNKYTGFAFGMGPERIAMLRYGITDIRDFYTNDIRFLKQFNRISGGDK